MTLPPMDPADFHAMMDAEKAQQADVAVSEPDTFTERTWSMWKNPVDRKNAAESRKLAMRRWRRAQKGKQN